MATGRVGLKQRSWDGGLQASAMGPDVAWDDWVGLQFETVAETPSCPLLALPRHRLEGGKKEIHP